MLHAPVHVVGYDEDVLDGSPGLAKQLDRSGNVALDIESLHGRQLGMFVVIAAADVQDARVGADPRLSPIEARAERRRRIYESSDEPFQLVASKRLVEVVPMFPNPLTESGGGVVAANREMVDQRELSEPSVDHIVMKNANRTGRRSVSRV